MTLANVVSTIAVVAAWACYFPLFLGRSGERPAPTARTDRTVFGFALQMAALILLIALRRPLFSPLIPAHDAELALAAVVVILAHASVRISRRALDHLGRRWNFTAALMPDHRLVTSGPFGEVRHPLSLGFLGLILATGLALSAWWALPATLPLFLAGTWIRIRSEEAVLEEVYQEEFEAYRKKVPRLFPRGFSFEDTPARQNRKR